MKTVTERRLTDAIRAGLNSGMYVVDDFKSASEIQRNLQGGTTTFMAANVSEFWQFTRLKYLQTARGRLLCNL